MSLGVVGFLLVWLVAWFIASSTRPLCYSVSEHSTDVNRAQASFVR